MLKQSNSLISLQMISLIVCLGLRAEIPPKTDPSLQDQEATINRTLQHCLDDPDNASTGSQDDCIDKATHAWDDLLNKQYQVLLQKLSSEDQTVLKGAQRAWITGRDADKKLLDAVYATVQGTMYAPMNANDVMMLTASRTRTLDLYLMQKAGRPVAWPNAPSQNKDSVSNGVKLSHRGQTAQLHGCSVVSSATARQSCAERLLPLYRQDLQSTEQAIRQQLPSESAKAINASSAAWESLQAAESKWIDALYKDPADQGTMKLKLVLDRVELLQKSARMIGVQ